MNFLRTCLEVSNGFAVEASMPNSFTYRTDSAVAIHFLNDIVPFGPYLILTHI